MLELCILTVKQVQRVLTCKTTKCIFIIILNVEMTALDQVNCQVDHSVIMQAYPKMHMFTATSASL